jgi:hypothetical protein
MLIILTKEIKVIVNKTWGDAKRLIPGSPVGSPLIVDVFVE